MTKIIRKMEAHANSSIYICM